jgi:tellurite methyltransferase
VRSGGRFPFHLEFEGYAAGCATAVAQSDYCNWETALILDQFGQIDIYLFDQLQRGRIAPGMRILDAGCGTGRNLTYLLQAGYDVFGADTNPAAIAEARRLAATLAPQMRADNFRVEALDALSFPKAFADVVICSAVLHFAADDTQFLRMLKGCFDALKPGGLFFCRLASSIGLDERAVSLGGRRYKLPDGSERYLVDESMLMTLTRQLPGELLDPLKTTVVQGHRSMTTWVVRSLV